MLYLSRYIIKNKGEYYRHLQTVREKGGLDKWIIWVLNGVKETAEETIQLIQGIRQLMSEQKTIIQQKAPKIYSKELLESLFQHIYTKILFVEKSIHVHRNTAVYYLNQLSDIGLLEKIKLGKSNYFINIELYNLFKQRYAQK